MNLSTKPLYSLATVINRRNLGILALGSLGACGGRDNDDQPPNLQIAQQPLDIDVREGDTAIFTVSVKDENQVNYQWLRNGSIIPGATNKTYTLAKTSILDRNAAFSVTITNQRSSIQSRSAVLNMTPAPRTVAEVVPSAWSTNLPPTGIKLVGKTGLIYFQVGEYPNTWLERYAPDGRRVSLGGQLTQLPLGTPLSPPETSWRVKETPSGEILVAEIFVRGTGINIQLGNGGRIRKINRTGDVTTVFESSTLTPHAMTADSNGNLYILDSSTGVVFRLSSSGDLTSLATVPNSFPYTNHFGFFSNMDITDDDTIYILTSWWSRNSITRLRGNQIELIDTGRYVHDMGTFGNSVYVLQSDEHSTGVTTKLLSRIDEEGRITTAAGTPGSADIVQFGSPGVIGIRSTLEGISQDGELHMYGSTYFSVLLPQQ